MKKLLLALLVLTLSAPSFASYRYRVRNYCDNVAHDTYRYTTQSVLDDTWIHADDAAHSGDVRDFIIVEVVEFDLDVKSRYDPTSGLPGGPAAGDAYICTATANGWTTAYLYIYDGAAWEEEIPHEGQEVWVVDENHDYVSYGGAWYKALELPLDGMLHFSFVPPGNGAICVLGWHTKTDSAASLTNGTPVTATVAGFNSHYVLNLTASSGEPYTITATGTSIDEATGVETGSDTEAISVTGTGWYQTTKSWVDAVVFTVPAGKTATVDVYRTSYWDRGNREYEAAGTRLEWKPDAATWSIQFQIQKVAADGSVSDIDNVTFANTDTPPRADNGQVGKYKRTDYSTAIAGDGKEGVVISIVDQTAIECIHLGFRFNK